MLVTYWADGMFVTSDIRYRKGRISAKNRVNGRLSGRPNLVSMLNQHMPGSLLNGRIEMVEEQNHTTEREVHK
jgi:hypothetical protein